MAADGMKPLVDYPPDFVRKRGDCRHSSNSYERRVRVDLGAVAVGPGSTLLRRSTLGAANVIHRWHNSRSCRSKHSERE
ncbi:MAG: hypothetical protein QOG58_3128 [Caballeronia sp.]|nr:hypothetical protein [Caballeronia sp.]